MARRRVESSKRRAVWRRLVEQWRESGLSQEAFCRQRRVSVASFRWWKWKLALPGRPQVEGGAGAGRPRGAVPAFVPVRIVEAAAGRVAAPGGAGFEIELPDGWRVRVPGDFEAESLARLLAVVQGRRAC